MKVAVATDSSVPELDPDNAELLRALCEREVSAVPVVWEDLEFDWSGVDLCIVRATFDYVHKRRLFLDWADRVSQQTRLFNNAETLRWNSHKEYLLELETRGVPVVPSALLRSGQRADLKHLMAEHDWGRVVVKPAVSASARETFLVDSENVKVGQARLERLLAREDLLVQPFMAGIPESGEVSIIYVNGRYSHAVRLVPKEGDFRVQSEFGGSRERVSPRTAELLVADHVLEVSPGDSLYARVDLLIDGSGEIRLGELEMVEPCLHLGLCPDGAVRLAEAILRLQ